MSLLRKLPHKTLNSFSILAISSRSIGTQNPNAKPTTQKHTPAKYDALINDAGRSRNFEELLRLLNQRITHGYSNTKRTFNFITAADISHSILDDLTQTLARLNEGYARKSAFDFLIVRLCELNQIDESLRVVNEMARRGYGLNARSFHLMLEILVSKNAVEEAWRVVDLMKELGFRPDVVVYNCFLMSYCAAGDLSGAAGVLRKMKEVKMKGDAHTYDALVLGACRAGKVEKALMLLRRMEDDGVRVLRSTHVYVLDAILKTECSEKAIGYVRSCSGKEKALDKENFRHLAKALVKSKRFKEATLVLEEMERRGLAMSYKMEQLHKMDVRQVKSSSLFRHFFVGN